MRIMDKRLIISCLDAFRDKLNTASDFIFDHPELAFHEYQAMDAICSLLESEGFQIEKGLIGIPTVFCASYGSGKPVIGILGEFDALDGMSQKSGTEVKEEIIGQPLGHGCGHHALGVGAAGAAIGIKKYLETTGMVGTVIYFGCPAEEGSSGKGFMVRDGLFQDVDCALTWHPSDLTGLFSGKCLANISAIYRFHGISAHAAGLAHIGRSALDAVELMNVGANYLREHIVPNARIHYAVTDTGGISPNVVQSHAAVYYYMRAPETWQVKEIYERMGDIAKGAALMTGTKVEVEYVRGVNSLVPNDCLNDLMHRNMQQIPLPQYTGKDYEMAKAMRETLGNKDVTFQELLDQMSKKERKQIQSFKGSEIYEFIIPKLSEEPLLFGSTDVGDVSNVCPVSQIHAAAYAAGTALHSWQAVSQGKTHVLHESMLYAAKVLACTAIDLIENPEIIKEAQEELNERLGEHPFESLMPAKLTPNFNRK